MFKLKVEQSDVLHTKWGTARINNKGYYAITTSKQGNRDKLLHRLIWENNYGDVPKGLEIHHKDNNKLNNCLMNMVILTKSDHMKLHKTGKNNPNFGKPLSKKNKKNISKSQNTTGFFRVSKEKCNRCKQGFAWKYQYYEDGRQKKIVRVNIKDLETEVKNRGLVWEVLNNGS